MRTFTIKNIIGLLLLILIVSGCYQGRPSKDEPIHLNPNMDNQPKYRPQAQSNFFEDGSTMRLPVEGTVARGDLREDSEYYTGKNDRGDFIKVAPVNITMALLKRGQERYNIYCSPCHSRVGDGRGIIVEKGMLPPPTFHSDSVRAYADGRVFDVITNGIRNMAAYRFQVPVEDRWAIVAYIRALQRSQNASTNDIPADQKGNL